MPQSQARISHSALEKVSGLLECYSEPYQNSQGKFGYRVKRIFLPNETVALPNFGDLSLDLSKVFPPSFLGE